MKNSIKPLGESLGGRTTSPTGYILVRDDSIDELRLATPPKMETPVPRSSSESRGKKRAPKISGTVSPFQPEPGSPGKKGYSPGKLLNNNSAKKQRGRLLNADGHERKKKQGVGALGKRLKKGVLVIKKECIQRQAPQEEELQDVRKALNSPTSLRVGKQ